MIVCIELHMIFHKLNWTKNVSACTYNICMYNFYAIIKLDNLFKLPLYCPGKRNNVFNPRFDFLLDVGVQARLTCQTGVTYQTILDYLVGGGSCCCECR